MRPGHARSSRPLERGGGQGLVEYGLILGIAAVVALVAIVVFGPELAAILSFIGSQVDAAG